MRIAFATTLSRDGSTVSGRIVPLARRLAALGHDTHVVLLSSPGDFAPDGVQYHTVGHEPFVRTATGKVRQRGLRLVHTMLGTAFKTTLVLWHIKPEVVVIVKPLPSNTLGVWWHTWLWPEVKVILDADDFELTANVLTSFTQRSVVHASTRLAASIADQIVVATPFLQDHFTNLVSGRKKISLIATGHDFANQLIQPQASPTILYLGSLSPSSGHRIDLLPTIFSAIATVYPTARLVIAGDGDNRAQLQAAFRATAYAAQVTWHGRFTPADSIRLLNQAQVLVDPIDASITARAKSSFRVMAALAFGKAVVTSNVGIRSTLIPAEFHSQCFATAGDAQDYAKKIIALLSAPLTTADQQQLQLSSFPYTWRELAPQYASILTSI